MVDKEILNKLYLFVLDKGENITTKDLKEMGFDYKLINQLLETKVISRVKRGEYVFEDISSLWKFGNEVKKEKQFDLSLKAFKYCYEHNVNRSDAAFQLFADAIFKENYEEALLYFDDLNEKYDYDKKIVLYLINIITQLPTKYSDVAKSLTKEDVCISSNFSRDTLKNHIRTVSLQGNFTYASRMLSDLSQNEKLTQMESVIRFLLYKVCGIDFGYRDKLKKYIKDGSYNEVIELLKEKESKYPLGNPEKAILKLVGVITDLKNNKDINITHGSNSKTVFEAITNEDYESAYKLNLSSQEKFGKNTYCEIFKKLLKEILELTKPKEVEVTPQVTTVEISNVSLDEHMELFIQKILSSNVDEAMDHVKQILISTNNAVYEKLIVDLIRISLLKKDISFSKVMAVLFLMKDGKYEFNSREYIAEFYMSLSQNKIEEAKLNLDIIEAYGDNLIDLKTMQNMLGRFEALTIKPAIVDTKKEVIPESKPIKPVNVAAQKTKEEPKVNTEKTKPLQKATNLVMEIDPSERKLFEERREALLENKGLMLLKPMSRERRHAIYKMTREYSNISAFSLGGDADIKPVVLKYYAGQKIPREEYHKRYMEVNALYKEKKFKECLEVCLDLLSRGKSASSLYAKVGFIYMYLKNIPKAIDYFTIANMLEDKVRDYSDLILNLKGQFPEEDRKPSVFMREQDFYDFDKFFTFEDFMLIISEVEKLGLDIECGCKELGKTPEETERIILLCAKVYYLQGNQERGDLFLNYFFRKEDKHMINMGLANDIQKNKKVYLARREDISLSLKLRVL